MSEVQHPIYERSTTRSSSSSHRCREELNDNNLEVNQMVHANESLHLQFIHHRQLHQQQEQLQQLQQQQQQLQQLHQIMCLQHQLQTSDPSFHTLEQLPIQFVDDNGVIFQTDFNSLLRSAQSAPQEFSQIGQTSTAAMIACSPDSPEQSPDSPHHNNTNTISSLPMSIQHPSTYSNLHNRSPSLHWPSSPISQADGTLTPARGTPLSPGGESNMSSDFGFDESNSPSGNKNEVKPAEFSNFNRDQASNYLDPFGPSLVRHLELLDQMNIPVEYQYRYDANLKMANSEATKKV